MLASWCWQLASTCFLPRHRWFSPYRGARHWFTGPIRTLETNEDGSAASGKPLYKDPEYI